MITPITSFRPSVAPKQNPQNNKQNGKNIAFKAIYPIIGKNYDLMEKIGKKLNDLKQNCVDDLIFTHYRTWALNEKGLVNADSSGEGSVWMLVTGKDRSNYADTDRYHWRKEEDMPNITDLVGLHEYSKPIHIGDNVEEGIRFLQKLLEQDKDEKVGASGALAFYSKDLPNVHRIMAPWWA